MAQPAGVPSPLHQQIAQLQEALRLGKDEMAERLWVQVKKAEIPLEVATLRVLSAIANRMGEGEFALFLWSRACNQFPDDVEFLNEASTQLLSMGRYSDARPLIERALEKEPRSAPALLNKGIILLDGRLYTEAMSVFEEAKKVDPRNAAVTSNLALAQNYCGYPQLALENARIASKLAPHTASIQATLGALYAQIGDNKQALAAYEKGLRANETSGACHYGIAELTKFKAENPRIVERMDSLLQVSLEPFDRGMILMALGKAYDDLGEYDRAFESLRVGNTLLKPASISDLHRELRILDRTCIALAQQPRAALAPGALRPLFIVGMPRSGTTLTEQILARHPDISTAGELSTLPELVDEFIGTVKSEPDVDERLTPERLDEMSQRYLGRLALARKGNATQVIDKAPGNYAFVGLIRLLFPNAVIVHTVRHPLDSCLSCYMRPLSTVPWMTDLGWIAMRYRYYREFVDDWKNVLVEVVYERLVDNPEAEIRTLLARCGLAWDPRCLDPQAGTGEAVRTASSWQVRQPIYRTSVARWTHYAKHLRPLAEGIRQYLSKDDIETLAANGVVLKTGAFSRLRGWLSGSTRT